MASQRDGDASMHGGQLFAGHFLSEGIKKTGAYGKITDGEVGAFVKKAKECRDALVNKEGGLVADITEAQTANDLIFPVLRELEWEIAYEQKTSTTDRPDAILHAQKDGKGVEVILENKNRGVNLDKRNGREAAPSSQMLRYLSNALNAEWGILTNGELWRLYYRRANSKSEQFLELDLGRILSAGNGDKDTLGAHPHWARVFMLMFGRDSYMPGNIFPDLAREESREWEQEITGRLSEKIFDNVFPQLARAFAGKNPDAKRLREARDAAMITLFRLLFVLYAEDRSLLPVGQRSYHAYELRRERRVLRELEDDDYFAATGGEKHRLFNKTCEFINKGEASINFPPYNGGLFDSSRAKLITENPLSDRDFMSALRALSYDGEKWINYRDFSVQHLGAMYERFLEQELYVSGNGAGQVSARPNKYARKSGGSYYTPEELVYLVIDGAVGVLLKEFKKEFAAAVKKKAPKEKLKKLDPAARALGIKVCDPAMGSGHFLVSLVDYLADWALAETVEAEKCGSHSPVLDEIEGIRANIKEQARKNKWQVEDRHLEDRQIVRRIVLKRVVYGADKNPMAVELAKLSLWLHTFTVGAPLTFLDHHLRCGDSLFGEFTGDALTAIEETGSPLFVGDVLKEAQSAAGHMRKIESEPDSVITQVQSSLNAFSLMRDDVADYDRIMSLWHCRHWLGGGDTEHSKALAAMEAELKGQTPKGEVAEFVNRANEVINRENFIHWEAAFPGVWSDWQNREGGFDAVIGNPPWDRMKMQEAEWFAVRIPEMETVTQALRKKHIEKLRKGGAAIIAEYDNAARQAEVAMDVARRCGAYPKMSGGDINLYSLFVERAFGLIKPEGMVGLLTPSGVFGDITALGFFRAITKAERVSKVIDFINRPNRYFADVDSRFKFCALIAGGAERKFKEGEFAFFVNKPEDIKDRRIVFANGDINTVNPNTGAMPVPLFQHYADSVVDIHRRLPILQKDGEESLYKIKYVRMLDMTNDSDKFIKAADLKKDGYYHAKPNNYKHGDDLCLPLYVGRMIDHYNHRFNSVRVNPDNPFKSTVSEAVEVEQLSDPAFCAVPNYWVHNKHVTPDERVTWMLGFRNISNATNRRTVIASLLPRTACGNNLPLLLPDLPPQPQKPTKAKLKQWEEECARVIAEYKRMAPLLAANMSSFALDFVARQKLHGTSLNWHIVRQLPMVPLSAYEADAGGESIGDFVRRRVLELSYTAHDMKPFAADMGYEGEPFAWDEAERAHKRAQLDALYFMLYGINAEELEYIMDSFPIVARQDEKEHGGYYTKDLISEYHRAYKSADWQHRATVSPYKK